MVWDLGKAMRKKEEFESARLMDFEFRQRARATRLLAKAFDLDPDKLVVEIATRDENEVLGLVAMQSGAELAAVGTEYERCRSQARRDLIAERGDPTPYRLG